MQNIAHATGESNTPENSPETPGHVTQLPFHLDKFRDRILERYWTPTHMSFSEMMEYELDVFFRNGHEVYASEDGQLTVQTSYAVRPGVIVIHPSEVERFLKNEGDN